MPARSGESRPLLLTLAVVDTDVDGGRACGALTDVVVGATVVAVGELSSFVSEAPRVRIGTVTRIAIAVASSAASAQDGFRSTVAADSFGSDRPAAELI